MVISGCNNIKTYCLYALFFRQIKNVLITDTDCNRISDYEINKKIHIFREMK